MFGWRRKQDGFVWSDYIRTTIKIRREDRARKIEELKQAAAAGAIDAGRQSLSAGRSGAGHLIAGVQRAMRAIGAAVRRGGLALFDRLWRALAWLGAGLMWLGARLMSAVRGGGQWGGALKLSAHAKIAAMFGGLGLLAGISAVLQYREGGAQWPMLLSGLVAGILLALAIAPWFRRIDVGRVWAGLRQRAGGVLQALSWHGAVPAGVPGRVGVAVAVLMVLASGYWVWQSGHLGAAATSVMTVASGGRAPLPDIKGRGRAQSGDTVVIGDRIVRLAGIEAPEISQHCQDQRERSWPCGQRARSVLARIIRRQTLTCSEVQPIDGGRYQASCTTGGGRGGDIADDVVEQGYAFAGGGLFSTHKSYASAEQLARDARRGIWQGAALRPAEFRAKRWEAAAKVAPDGCAIKGRVVRNAKVYVLPWALDYRQVRVSARRGERWFCSEAEATNAGFRPSSAG